MKRKLQTLDLEFDEYCERLLLDGMPPIKMLQIKSQLRFIWDECRRRCAGLCVEHGLIGAASAIRTNEDGQLIDV